MPTVIGFRAAQGAVIAADRTVVAGGRIRSRDRRRVYGFDGWGLAVAGDDVDAVRDRVEAAVREYRTERDRTPGVEPLGRMAGVVAEEFDATLVVAGRDESGSARVVAVHADGSRLVDSPVAFGSGVELALGRLEAADLSVDDDRAADLARDVIADVSERDPGTGETVDAWTLGDD